MAELKPNSKMVLDYVKAHDGEDFTAADIANATGLSKRTVDGIVTSAFQKKGVMVREAAEIELEDGTHSTVKFIRLTAEGKTWTPEVATDAE